MGGYAEGKHDDPAGSKDRLLKIRSKYQATAPSVADGDNTYLLVDSAGRPLIAGSVAHDAPDAGNPVKVGGKAHSGVPTAVTDADRVDAFFDERGVLAVKLVDPDNAEDYQREYMQTATGITANGTGATLDMSKGPKSKFTRAWSRTAGASNADIDVQGSLDGTNWFDLINEGAIPEGATFKVDAPVSYIRYNVIDVGSGNTITIILLAVE